MQTFTNNRLKRILVIVLTSFVSFSINIEQARSAGGDTNQPNLSIDVTPSLTITPSPNSTPFPSVPTQLQLPNSGSSFNNSTGITPNCSSLCFYGNLQSAPSSSGNGSQLQGTIGMMWQPSSSEQSWIELNKRLLESQISRNEDDQKFFLIQRLAEAINTNNVPMARGAALLLAPKFNKTPQQLIDEFIKPIR